MYQYPENLKISGIESLMLDEKTRLAITTAAQWLDDHPDFEPKFERIFNVILAKNKETIAMTQEVYKLAGIKEDKTPINMPLMDVDFSTYCLAVNTIKKLGWDGYIDAIQNPAKQDTKGSRPFAL